MNLFDLYNYDKYFFLAVNRSPSPDVDVDIIHKEVMPTTSIPSEGKFHILSVSFFLSFCSSIITITIILFTEERSLISIGAVHPEGPAIIITSAINCQILIYAWAVGGKNGLKCCHYVDDVSEGLGFEASTFGLKVKKGMNHYTKGPPLRSLPWCFISCTIATIQYENLGSLIFLFL